MSNTLRNCPRCGNDFIIMISKGNQYQAICVVCELTTPIMRTKEKAISKWNKDNKLDFIIKIINKLRGAK